MKTSETITKITPAFLAAQKKIDAAVKDEKNPHFGNTFASHKSVIEACKDKLNDEGIAVLQPIDGMTVETVLVHVSGEWFSSSTPIVSKDEHNPQALGSAITYAKRYGLQSMVLLPAEDDDGIAASHTQNVVETKASQAIGEHFCKVHNKALLDRGEGIWDHRMKLNDQKQYDENGVWHHCQGAGWVRSIR